MNYSYIQICMHIWEESHIPYTSSTLFQQGNDQGQLTWRWMYFFTCICAPSREVFLKISKLSMKHIRYTSTMDRVNNSRIKDTTRRRFAHVYTVESFSWNSYLRHDFFYTCNKSCCDQSLLEHQNTFTPTTWLSVDKFSWKLNSWDIKHIP